MQVIFHDFNFIKNVLCMVLVACSNFLKTDFELFTIRMTVGE